MGKRMPPIKTLSLEAFGPLFLAVKLQAENKEHQVRLWNLS
jgi:hypothetical protein